MPKKVYVIGGNSGYARFIKDYELVENIEDANIVVLTGGCDVDPSIYGHKKLRYTYSDINRDNMEIAEFNKVRQDQLVVGVCRGLQLLNAIHGGKLYQNVNNHSGNGTHLIVDIAQNKLYETTSIHHQMVYPWSMPDNDYTILAVVYDRLSRAYESDGLNSPQYEIEVMSFHAANKPFCIGVQGHPEMMRPEAPFVKYVNELIDKYVIKN